MKLLSKQYPFFIHENITIEIFRSETQAEWGKKNPQQTIQEWCKNYQRYNICIMGIPERRKNEKEIEAMCKVIMTKNSPNDARDKRKELEIFCFYKVLTLSMKQCSVI